MREVADVAVSSRQLDIELSNAKAALDSTERAYRLAQFRYKAGASDYQSVLIVEDRLLARRRIVSALQSRAFILDVALVRSLGGGFTS
ncbi:MAG: TolC family protein, partial [Sphingomonas sp.]